MNDPTLLIVRLYVELTTRLPRGHHRDGRDDRGDVPGWVLITVMTVGLVAIISTVAGDELRRLLRSALRSVG